MHHGISLQIREQREANREFIRETLPTIPHGRVSSQTCLPNPAYELSLSSLATILGYGVTSATSCRN